MVVGRDGFMEVRGKTIGKLKNKSSAEVREPGVAPPAKAASVASCAPDCGLPHPWFKRKLQPLTQIVKHLFLLATILVLLVAASQVRAASINSQSTAAGALIARVLPDHAAAFVCELIPAAEGNDVFEIEARAGKIVLRGNNGVSLAMAFNWYLREEALMSYDWQATGPLVVKETLPLPKEKIRRVCLARERFFLNYCTYGYTFPFTDFAGWQRFLDWLALNGVNRPLMQCG